MSAAEKLRALEPIILTVRAGEESKVYPVGEKTLYEIPLPQLVAVVEAVEWALEHDDGNGPPTMRIGAALAALDESL